MIKTTVLIDKPYKNFIDIHKLIKVSKFVFKYFNILDAELSISIVGDDEIKSLNNKFRSINSSTDVLSFPSKEINPETEKKYFGDVIISFPTAERQFAEYHDSIIEEIIFLVIHGILHLLNFDHENAMQKKTMYGIQNYLFKVVSTI